MPSVRLADLAKKINSELHGDGDIIINSVASIKSARAGDITFIANRKYREELLKCQASAVILSKNDLPFTTMNALVVNNPYLTYARVAQILDTTPHPAKQIAPSAIISSSAQLGKNVSIGANTVIESNVILGSNVLIGSGCFIGKSSRIGEGSRIWANVTIYHKVKIGKNCLIHSGTVIGADGFGYVNDRSKWIKIPQLGDVIIGNCVEIGACTTIDRGTLDDTVIGNGVIIDNQCQIAHNVVIGDNTAIAGGVTIAGSSKIGRCCMIGGASVLNGHIEICDKVIITGMGMVIRSISEPGIYSSGIPIQSNRLWRKTAVLVMNINDINKRLKAIERKID